MKRESSDDDLHWLGIRIQHWFGIHADSAAVPLLMLLHEKGICPLCRCDTVEVLLSLNPLPAWMQEECRYDSDLETRKLVTESLD